MRKSFSKHQHKNIPQHAALDFCGVEDITVNAAVAFTVNSSQVFRDDIDITPVTLSNGIQYMPWGADNMMPYNILDMIEKDETLSTCQMFNAEIASSWTIHGKFMLRRWLYFFLEHECP